MPEDRTSDWYLLDNKIQEGPLTEAEMRACLRSSSSSSLQVKQGDSDWYGAEDVRRKIDLLNEHGIYVRVAGTLEGPFTFTRAYRLLENTDVAGIEIRTGAQGKWIRAEKWLRKIQELRQRTEVELRSLSDSLRRSLASLDSPNRPASDLLGVSEQTIDAILIEDSGEIPIAELFEPPPRTTKRPELPKVKPNPTRPSTPPSLAISAEQFAGLKSSPRKRNPGKKAGRPASRRFLLAMLGTVCCVLLTLGIIVFFRGAGQSSTSRTPPTSTSVAAAAATSALDSSSLVTTSADRNASPPVLAWTPDEVAQGPPTLQDGMLFRPQFTTNQGIIDAGTAFAARIDGMSGVVIISALHLFGPAGGLDVQITSEQLPSTWQGLTLEDCHSRNWFGEVAMRPVLFKDAKPFPEPSVFGDVVACVVADQSGFTALPLASRDPVIGEQVWMVSNVMGSASTRHPAKVFGVEDGWLLYQFEQPYLDLRATSGAPIVDQWGRVVAVNAGGAEHQGALLGMGTPVTKFAEAIQHQLGN